MQRAFGPLHAPFVDSSPRGYEEEVQESISCRGLGGVPQFLLFPPFAKGGSRGIGTGDEVVGTARAMDCVSVIPAEGVIAAETDICYTVPSTE